MNLFHAHAKCKLTMIFIRNTILNMEWNEGTGLMNQHHTSDYVRKIFAKCLLIYNYLIDMPLSLSFLKMFCMKNSIDEDGDR